MEITQQNYPNNFWYSFSFSLSLSLHRQIFLFLTIGIIWGLGFGLHVLWYNLGARVWITCPLVSEVWVGFKRLEHIPIFLSFNFNYKQSHLNFFSRNLHLSIFSLVYVIKFNFLLENPQNCFSLLHTLFRVLHVKFGSNKWKNYFSFHFLLDLRDLRSRNLMVVLC